jgi:cardiolipin synthase
VTEGGGPDPAPLPGAPRPRASPGLRHRVRRLVHPECGWPEQWRRIRRRVFWMAVALTAASVPILVLALVGLPHVFRNLLVRNVLAPEAGAALPTLEDSAFDGVLALVTGRALRGGSTVEVLLDGDGTFPRLWADLRSAQRSITVQMYYAGPGAVADSASRLLAEQARAGVDVFFLYDAFGAQDLPRRYLDSLRAAGVKTAEFRPLRWYALDRAQHRSHVRGIVIDGSVAYTGGFGLDDKWLGDGKAGGEWRETNARFGGLAATQLQAVFVAEWAEATGELLAWDRLLPSGGGPARDGPSRAARAALLYSPAVTGSTTGERLLALAIASARRRLYVANAYFVPRSDYVRLLVDAARRGVDVRVLTNGPASDVRTTWLASRARYQSLLDAGVRIYEYRPTTMHAKTLVVDGLLSAVTTMNFDNRSLAYNNEVALLARDARLGARLDSLFLEDLHLADEIRLEDFRRRPWSARVLEWAASAVASFL